MEPLVLHMPPLLLYMCLYIATPNGWCLENVSQLLVHCGKDISKGVLGCRAANARTEELIIICFYMANACLMKDGYEAGSEENIRYVINSYLYVQYTMKSKIGFCWFKSPKEFISPC